VDDNKVMDRHAQFAEFLKSRRARVKPEDSGLPASLGRRRTPGLRREEVAQLAGVSVDYYVRLEQGRKVQPSAAVLNALAKALQLDEDEHRHMVALASQEQPARRAMPERVRPGIRRLLERLGPTPGFVLGRRMDVLAWNTFAEVLLGDFGAQPPTRRNMIWLLFLDPRSKSLYVDWAANARESIAHLRAASGRHPNDPLIAELVDELSVKSSEFRLMWADHDVREKGYGRKVLNHPEVGRLTLEYETLRLSQGDDQVLVTYTAEADSPSQAALDLLAVLARATPESGWGRLRSTERS
jgi:transcriptional regulator with XRE-family HTH domain